MCFSLELQMDCQEGGSRASTCLLMNAGFYGCHLRRLHVGKRAADWLQGGEDGGKMVEVRGHSAERVPC